MLVLVAIALRVGDVDAPGNDRLPEIDVVVAIDRTTSMAALDGPGGAGTSRLAGVREDLDALVEAMPTARFSLITFGERADVAVPFTTDREALMDVVDAVLPESATAGTGSSLDRPVSLISTALAGTRLRDDDRRRLLVVATDGENTAAGTPGTYAPLAAGLDGGLVLGYGTRAGARMPLLEETSGSEGDQTDNAGPSPSAGDTTPTEFVIDTRTGEPAVSRIDETNLQTIADELGGTYVHRRGPGGMEQLAAGLRGAALDDLEPVPPQRQVTWLWALLLLALALAELRLGWRGYVEARREARR